MRHAVRHATHPAATHERAWHLAGHRQSLGFCGMAALAAMLIPASVLSTASSRAGDEVVPAARRADCSCVGLRSSFDQLLVLEIALGAVLAGLPAAIAYLGEERTDRVQGRALGLYIAGHRRHERTLHCRGGHRLELWRVALAVLGPTGGLAAVIFWRQLPHRAILGPGGPAWTHPRRHFGRSSLTVPCPAFSLPPS